MAAQIISQSYVHTVPTIVNTERAKSYTFKTIIPVSSSRGKLTQMKAKKNTHTQTHWKRNGATTNSKTQPTTMLACSATSNAVQCAITTSHSAIYTYIYMPRMMSNYKNGHYEKH